MSIANYYVDATLGSDDNPGTIAEPWQTLSKCENASNAGVTTRFWLKRGETWRESFSLYGERTQGTATDWCSMGAYGTGAKPVISGGALLPSTAWADQGSNIWRAGTGYGSAPVALTTEVGVMVLNGGTSVGANKRVIGDVTSQGDFFYSTASNYIDMYSTSNPGTYYTSIETSQFGEGGTAGIYLFSDYLKFSDISIRCYGYNGVQIGSGVSNLIMENCDFQWCGGAYDTYSEGGVLDGNAIMTWQNVDHLTIRYCTFSDIQVAGVTLQSNSLDGAAQAYIYIYRNSFTRCGFVFEPWVYTPTGSTTLDNLYLCNNVSYYDSASLMHAGEASDYSVIWLWADANINCTTTNAYIENNIFYDTRKWYIKTQAEQTFDGWTIDYNCYYPDTLISGYGRFCGPSQDTKQFAGWATETGTDANSIITDPVLVNAAGGDFRIAGTSPCVDDGTVVPNVTGPYKGAAPDMGLHEYGSQKQSLLFYRWGT